MSIRALIAIVIGLLAPFLFPATLVAFIVLAASVVVPPIGIVSGVLTDALYRTPTIFPYATVFGGCATVLGFIVHRFIKTRIIRL